MKMNLELFNSIKSFLDAFEKVFESDWEYSKEMLGIYDISEEQRQNRLDPGLEEIEVISFDGTFLNPKIEDEIEDWGNRGYLLSEYRNLKKILLEIENNRNET